MAPKKRQTLKNAVEEYHVENQDVNTENKKHLILQLRRVDVRNDEPVQATTTKSDEAKPPQHKYLSPHKSNVCYWCCHAFQNESIGLPVKLKNNQFHVCGHFCSFECAASFNFNSTELGQNVWESYHLLNMMARQMGIKKPITQATSRYALKMFGGWMDIEEFRTNNVQFVPLPVPMIPIVQVMDEITSTSLASKHSFVPLDNNRIMKAKQNIFNAYKKDSIHDKMKMGHTTEEA